MKEAREELLAEIAEIDSQIESLDLRKKKKKIKELEYLESISELKARRRGIEKRLAEFR